MSDRREPEIVTQELLQNEERHVVDTLGLPESLTRAGRPVQLGSSVLGLMTWRDIDFHVYCEPLDPDACYESLRPVAANPQSLRLTFPNRLGIGVGLTSRRGTTRASVTCLMQETNGKSTSGSSSRGHHRRNWK